jgi:hypothetical protein
MIPVGYMAKRVARRPDWIGTPQVIDVYSVSDCVNDNFVDYIQYWKHNDQWFFDSPEMIKSLAAEVPTPLEDCVLFFYESYELECDGKNWNPCRLVSSRTSRLIPLPEKRLEGFDVVTFRAGTSPEHSPLSCNSIADAIPTNNHCLFDSIEEAKNHLENRAFGEGEPGPYRIYAVYTVAWPESAPPDAALK